MNIHSVNHKPGKPVDFGPHEPWKGRPVLWVCRDGVLHVARHAATVLTAGGPTVVSKVLCGGGSTFWPHATSWYDMRRQGKRFCRRCVAKLRAKATPVPPAA